MLATIEELVEEARAGRLFIMVDDEGRENEGDLIIPSAHATPAAINFMMMHGRGIVCLALTQTQANQLDLPLMQRGKNESPFHTNFTLSIEARQGVTTGVSAYDRARTIAVATDPQACAEDIVVPGHVFPLIAKKGGVLVRPGHTEASVDMALLAGLTPAAVICEIVRDDGHMARRPDLEAFAQSHGLKMGSIAALVDYRSRQAA